MALQAEKELEKISSLSSKGELEKGDVTTGNAQEAAAPSKDTFAPSTDQKTQATPQISTPETSPATPANDDLHTAKNSATPQKSIAEAKLTAPDMTFLTPKIKQINDLWLQGNLLSVRQAQKQKGRTPKKANAALERNRQQLSELIPKWNQSARLLQSDYKQHIKAHRAVEKQLIQALRQNVSDLRKLNPSKKARVWKWTKRLGMAYLAGFVALKGWDKARNTPIGGEVTGCIAFNDRAPMLSCFSPLEALAQPWLKNYLGLAHIFGPEQKASEKLLSEIRTWGRSKEAPPEFAWNIFTGASPKEDAERIHEVIRWMEKNRGWGDVDKTNQFFKKLLRQYVVVHHPDKYSLLASKAERDRLADEYRDHYDELKTRYEQFEKSRPHSLGHKRFFY